MKQIIFLSFLLVPSLSFGHQPVMDMAPRWSGGYGFQTRYESVISDRLNSDGQEIANPQGLYSESFIQWFEGVYTFHRSFRVTFKLPYENRKRRFLKDGAIKDAEAFGFGDLILAFPIKRYKNYMTHTTNLAFTPSFFLPTGSTKGNLPLGRGTMDYGLSVSLAWEAVRTFGLWDLSTRINTNDFEGKKKGNLVGFDMNFGIYPYQNSKANFATLLLWGTHARHEFKDRLSNGAVDENSGGVKLEMAPILVILYKNLAFRVESYFPVYKRLNGTQLTNDYNFQMGIGITFSSLKPY